MMDIWQRNLPQTLERLDVLDLAASSDPLPEDLREQATSIAHKLAGSLGMFGFKEGTRLGRTFEQNLESGTPDRNLLSALSTELRQTLFPTDS